MVDKKMQLLVIDDNLSILTLFEEFLSNDYSVLTTNSPKKSLELCKIHDEISVIISDYEMPGMNGVELLQKIDEILPLSRKILVSGKLSLSVAINAVNSAKINGILPKPIIFTELNKIVDEQIRIYQEQLLLTEKFEGMKNLRGDSQSLYHGHEDIVETLFYLSETQELADFSNILAQILSGIRSLAEVNMEYFFIHQDSLNFDFSLAYISDIEVIANQYEQKSILLYVLLMRTYYYAYIGKMKFSKENFKAVISLKNWLRQSYIDPSLVKIIEDYEKFSKEEIQTEDLFDQITQKNFLESKIRQLYGIKIDDLINLDTSIFKTLKHDQDIIYHFIIMKDELPIFDRKSREQTLDKVLIGGFITALNDFISEAMSDKTFIEKITFSLGVLLIQKIGNLTFILITYEDNIKYRIALRTCAAELKDLVFNLKKNHLPDDDCKTQIDEVLTRYLGKFWTS